MQNQPILDLPKTAAERWLDVGAWIFVAVNFALALGYYPDLPETIPTHYNASGQPDKFGPKAMIFLMPGIAFILAASMVYLSKFPHKFNYLTKITPENAASEYQRMRVLLRVVNALTSLLFLVVNWNTLQNATGVSKGLGIEFFIVFIAVVIVPPFVLLGGQRKKA